MTSRDTARPLSYESVTRTYGNGSTEVRALVDITIEIGRGEFVAVMGPSGSGKSTLLTIAGGLEAPTSGTVRIDGIDLAALSKKQLAELRLRRVGYVFQEYNLLSALTATENVAMPLELAGSSRLEAAKAARRQLEALGLGERVNHTPDDLSGGEQQRVAIARALVVGSQLILADEPTGALDSATGESVMNTLRQACADGASALIATHDARLAAWADRIVFIHDGRIADHTDGQDPVTLLAQGPTA